MKVTKVLSLTKATEKMLNNEISSEEYEEILSAHESANAVLEDEFAVEATDDFTATPTRKKETPDPC